MCLTSLVFALTAAIFLFQKCGCLLSQIAEVLGPGYEGFGSLLGLLLASLGSLCRGMHL